MSIKVKNNRDGTYTVECAGESAVVGTPLVPFVPVPFPPISSSDGSVVAHIINRHGWEPRGTRVNDVDSLLREIRNRVATLRAGTGPDAESASQVLDFTLQGQHSIDIGHLREALEHDGQSLGLQCRIFLDDEHG